ncbi:MAG TPA: Uma2 family endonuclease [Kofleriaceae bacterium]
MRVVLADPDREWLAERRRLGLDRRDEVWDGVLHVPPSPTTAHQEFEHELNAALKPIAKALGLRSLHELTVYDPAKGELNYRTPDIVVAAPSDVSERGIEGHAELVVEVLSPNDESRNKFDFYAARRIPEYWIVDPNTRVIEVYVLRGDTYFPVQANRDGAVNAPRLKLELAVVTGPKLRITWADGSVEI